MAVSLVNTGIQFPDSTIQTTAAGTGSVTVLATNTFNSSGTYTRADGANGDTVIVTVVGAGGGGGAAIFSNATFYYGAGGGGGGGYVTVAIPYDIVPSTVAVTVGAGGVGGNTANTTTALGANGGISIFDKFAIARGGGGGGIYTFGSIPLGRPGAGGTSRGGALGNGNNNVASSINDESDTLFRGGRGTAGACTSPFAYNVHHGATGGGGGVYHNGISNTFMDGGYNRVYGSGGNTYGANGGAQGGGGAANLNGIGGTGGDGTVIITVVSGKISAADFAAKTSNTASGVTAYYN
jgi:hypothetical protein